MKANRFGQPRDGVRRTDTAKGRFHQELTAGLYARGLLSFGKASELAGIHRFAFSDVLAQRQIARHYGQEDITEDASFASGQ